MAEVSSFSPFVPPAESSSAASKRRRHTVVESSPDEISDSSDDDMPKDIQTPSGIALPEVNVEMASPPHGQEETLPIVTGNV
jgi:hypothetical protein